MTEHDPSARECIRVGLSPSELHDGPCPACRELSAVVDLDPDFGSAKDGRPHKTMTVQERLDEIQQRAAVPFTGADLRINDVPKLLDALRAVLDIHTRVNGLVPWCKVCQRHSGTWPCLTVRAITEALGV